MTKTVKTLFLLGAVAGAGYLAWRYWPRDKTKAEIKSDLVAPVDADPTAGRLSDKVDAPQGAVIADWGAESYGIAGLSGFRGG